MHFNGCTITTPHGLKLTIAVNAEEKYLHLKPIIIFDMVNRHKSVFNYSVFLSLLGPNQVGCGGFNSNSSKRQDTTSTSLKEEV